MFIVISQENGTYHLTTHTMFHTRAGAESYANGIAASRNPVVVEYDGKPFRDDATARGFVEGDPLPPF